KNAIYVGKPYQGVFRAKSGVSASFLSTISPDNIPPPYYRELNFLKEVHRWKLIDEKGKMIDTAFFSYIGPLNDGIATARISKLDNNNGKSLVPRGPKYTHKWTIINTEHKELIDPIPLPIVDPGNGSPFLIVQKDSFAYHLLDSAGNFLSSRDQFWVNPDDEYKIITQIENFQDGMARVKIDGKWGYINTTGKIIIPPEYRNAQDFSQGLAAIRFKNGWGYINGQGDIEIKPKFQRAGDFVQGRAPVKMNSGWGYIDLEGKKASKFNMRKLLPYEGGEAQARIRYWGVLDLDGKWLVKPAYGQIEKSGDYWKVRQKGIFGYVDKKGNTVLDMRYPDLGIASEDRISFMVERRYGFLDMDGEEVIPPTYQDAGTFSEGLAGVNYFGKWGFIDREGNMIIKPTYEKIRDFTNGVAVVNKGLWGVIDKAGKTVIPFEYVKINRNNKGWLTCLHVKTENWEYFDSHGIKLSHKSFEGAKPVNDELSSIEHNERKNLINLYGIPITYPGYNDIANAGKEVIIASSKRLLGLIDREGEEILPPIYESIEYIDGLFQVSRYGEIGYLRPDGNWLYPLSDNH
ncbi:MAG: WG repeat-containing protein, partial [Bacteroidetes bacterium]|nr:WG repeat-containing protein [Bacteroidota bacterium]